MAAAVRVEPMRTAHGPGSRVKVRVDVDGEVEFLVWAPRPDREGWRAYWSNHDGSDGGGSFDGLPTLAEAFDAAVAERNPAVWGVTAGRLAQVRRALIAAEVE